jgi:flagellar hook-associated protein 1 FlgK
VSSFGSILSIARTAIASHQTAMQTVSHNLANAETPGYSRQRAELTAKWPQAFGFGIVGTGATVSNVIRLRDEMLDNSFRREAGTRDAFLTRRDVLAEAEGILGEPGDSGLTPTLDAFWNAWSDLSNNPASASSRNVVRQRGIQVASALNSYTLRLNDLGSRTREKLSSTVDEINVLAGQVADLNRQITSAEVNGLQAPDLRDARDRIADKLAELAGARTEIQANGTLGVYVRSMMLVDATNARTLEVRGGTQISLGIKGDPDPLIGVAGPIAEMVELVNVDLPAIASRLDSFARGLVNGVNEYHMSGWTAAGDALGGANWNPLNGPTGSRVAFFDPNWTTAGGIRVSSAVMTDVNVVAASDTQNAPGNNAIALSLAALRDDVGMDALRTRMGANFATLVGFASGTTYTEHHATTIADLGVSVSDAGHQYQVYDTLARQADGRRASVSGVSIDEELTLMMRHQQAYVAATRVVQAADEMAQAILSMV